MESYQPFKPKYFYKGKILIDYCRQNNISYYSVLTYVNRKLEKDNTKSIDDLIDEGINTINRYGVVYYYKGIPLKDYAKQNNLNAGSIRCSILREKVRTNKPLQEIIDECVESYKKFSLKYYHNGIPLVDYCNRTGLNYKTIIKKYLSEYKNDTNISTDNAIKQIVEYYQEHPCIKNRYYFNNESLTKFCDTNGYPYVSIYRRIKTLESKNDLLDNDEIIELAIKKYENRLQINKINEIFSNLKTKKININELKDICNYLKIDFDNVLDLVNMDFSYNQAVNMIWYFSDKTINNNYKIITDKKIEAIFNLIHNLKNSIVDIEQLELFDLIGIYKSELYDSRSEILLRQKNTFQKQYFHYAIIMILKLIVIIMKILKVKLNIIY